MKKPGFVPTLILSVALALLVAPLMAFADSDVEVSDGQRLDSIAFIPCEDTYDIEQMLVKDSDGLYWLDMGLRDKESSERSFFIGGDRCQIKHYDNTTKMFMFDKSISATKALFKASDGEEIELEAISEVAEEQQTRTELPADDLAAFLGTNPMRITYNGVSTTSNFNIVESPQSEDDELHNCLDACKPIAACEASCEKYGFVIPCLRCQICGTYYEDEISAEKKHPITFSKVVTDPLGHEWETVEIINEMTVDEQGLQHVKCSRCEQEENQIIPRDLVKITKQPENCEVNYPDGAMFKVEVDRPENVKSYRWELRVEDEAGVKDAIFQLDGSTAKSDTLYIPSTDSDQHVLYFKCYITDVDGTVIVSDEGALTIANPLEPKHVLYVHEYALEPGNSIDLSDIDCGSGTITYDENATDIYFENVQFNNKKPKFDSANANSTGIFLKCSEEVQTYDEYTMHFNGNCYLDNEYFDPVNNLAGTTVNAFFAVDDQANYPTLAITGDSPVTLRGGTYCIYTDGALELKTDVNIRPVETNYEAGMRARTVIINEGVTADIKCCGTGILAAKGGDINIFKGAKVLIDSTLPHISKGFAAPNLLYSDGGFINCTGAEIDIKATSIPEHYLPFRSYVARLCGIMAEGSVTLDDTDVKIEFFTKPAEKSYVSNYNGIECVQGSLMMENDSSIDINVNDPSVFGMCGIVLGRKFIAEPDSRVSIDIRTDGKVTGLWMDEAFEVEDSIIDVNVASTNADDNMEVRGILCDTANIAISDSKYYVHSTTKRDATLSNNAKQGVAFIAGSARTSFSEVGYDPEYTSELIQLSGKASIFVPEKSTISSYNYMIEDWFEGQEAIYDISGAEAPSAPATEVLITAPKDQPEPSGEDDSKPVAKKKNTLYAKGKTVTLKAKTLKKAKRTIVRKDAIKVKKAEGDVTYTLKSVKKAKYRKYFTINKKSGKITVKKGLRKGTYRITVKVKAAGNNKFRRMTKQVTVKVRVK